MKIVKLSALHTVAFIPKETSLALVCVRGSVNTRVTLRLERLSQRISPATTLDSNSHHFGFKCSVSPKYATLCPFKLRIWGPLCDNKEINVNPSLSSIRYQNPNCWYHIYIYIYIYIYISPCISTRATFKSDQTVCEMQYYVWKWCWSGTGGKYC